MTLLSETRPPIEFDWEEVNCFLRPQAMLCDQVAPGTGLLLLCLESLYQATGTGGFFGFPGLGHFAFADAVFTPLAGVELHRSFVDERGAVLDALAERARGGPVLVPANCRHLPYFKGHGREDKLHFFIVTGAAGDAFQVLDYLHVHEDNHSLEYAPTTLSREMMGRVTEDYWDTWVGVAPLTADMDERFWLLRVRATGSPPAEDEIPALLLAECARLLDAPATGRTLDERYLAELRKAQEAGDEDRLSFLLENYLADANAALRYVKIVEHALGAVGGDGAEPGLAALVDEYRAKSTALRSKLMVRCMVAPSLPQAEWDAFRDGLGGLAARLRGEVRRAIPPSF